MVSVVIQFEIRLLPMFLRALGWHFISRFQLPPADLRAPLPTLRLCVIALNYSGLLSFHPS
jgi:hypothetical protein